MKYKLVIESETLIELQNVINAINYKKEMDSCLQMQTTVAELPPPREIKFGETQYKSCNECGKEFIPKRVDSIYCSKQCSQKAAFRRFTDKNKKESVDEKLNRLKETYPKPAKRPNIQRDFTI